MRLTNFKIESPGYETFEGFTRGEVWNGWDCPYFDFEQANNILKSCNNLRSIIAQEPLAYYDLSLDAFVFPDEDDSEVFAPFTEDGKKYCPIGAFCWIWEEANQGK